MISELLKRILYSSLPKVTLYDKFVATDVRLAAVETSVVRAGRGAIGESFMFNGVVNPTGSLVEDGSAIPRTTYPALMDVIAPNFSGVVITNGSTQVTGVPAATIALLGGAGTKTPQIPVEGVGLPVGCKIASIAGTTITLSVAANAAGTNIRIFFHGNGDGNTTFSLPNGADFWRGKDPSNVKDAGRVIGSGQIGSIQSHAHPTWYADKYRSLPVTAATGSTIWAPDSQGDQTGLNTGATGGTETRPANTSKLPCIWAF